MFKNRAMQVQMVKTNKENHTSSHVESHVHVDFEQINKIALSQIKNAAIVGFGGVAALKVVTAVCQIAVNIAPKR